MDDGPGCESDEETVHREWCPDNANHSDGRRMQRVAHRGPFASCFDKDRIDVEAWALSFVRRTRKLRIEVKLSMGTSSSAVVICVRVYLC